MKFKYRLVEQEEESGLKGLRGQNELILTAIGDYTADKLISILKDPKNLGGVFTIKSKDFKDFEKKVFGEPNIPANNNKNKELYKENGMPLYKEIIKVVGAFEKGTPVVKKDKAGNIEYYFITKTPNNMELVKKYFSIIQGDKSIEKSELKPVKTDEYNLKFPVGDESDLKKILNNAGLTSGKDYKLIKQKIEENK